MHIIKQAKNILSAAYTAGLNLIAPPFCAHCRIFLSADTVFCAECVQMIQPVVSATVELTKKKSIKVFAIGKYQDPLKGLVLAKGLSDIAATNQLGQLMAQLNHFKHMPCDLLVPVPLHWTRFSWRGYNQADEMAQVIARANAKQVVPLLKRVVQTKHQSECSPDKRFDNVREVFTLQVKDTMQYKDKHIVLVDDLMTTGATLRSAAKELLKLKPASITALVACRAV